MTPQQVKESHRNKALSVHTSPSTETQFMGFNPQHKILQDKTMREAISKAINTDDLSSDKKLKGLFQQNVQYVNAHNQPDHVYSPSTSKSLIRSLGYKMNNDGYFEKDGHILSLKLALKRMNFQNGRRKLKSCSKTLKSRN